MNLISRGATACRPEQSGRNGERQGAFKGQMPGVQRIVFQKKQEKRQIDQKA